MLRPHAIAALVLLALTLTLGGCKSNCLQLAGKICDCQPTATARDNCNTQASTAEGLVTESATDQANCAALLNKCDCHALDTTQGKINCGLARDPTWPVATTDGGT